MERSRLFQLLAGDDEVRQLARTALDAGAQHEVQPACVLTRSLLSTYARRQRTTQRAGQPTLGFGEALDDLRSYRGAELALGSIDDRLRGGYYFQLFLTPELDAVIACLGVKPSGTSRTT